MSEETAKKSTMNRAKPYQLVLLPFNNGATNVCYILTITYIAYYDNGVLSPALMFTATMVTVMRLFDTVVGPIIGALIDETNGKFDKFRPYMAIGNLIMAVGTFLLYFGARLIPNTMMWLRYVMRMIIYAVYMIGYTLRTSCIRPGQTVLTNDPSQRPLFTIFNLVASMLGMGTIRFLAPILRAKFGDYTVANFFDMMIPIAVVISAILTPLAVIGVWEKDQPKYCELGAETQEKVKISEYLAIIKENEPLRRLMVAGADCKLAPAITTSGTVLYMLYGAMMSNYNTLYLPTMMTGYVFSTPFFALTIRTSRKHGQEASLVRYVALVLIMYVGVLALLLFWQPGNVAFNLSLTHISMYTVLFVVFFGVGYGAYYATVDMPAPMVTDCSDYETYHSGKYIPGVMGTLFSLVDKLVSFLSSAMVSLAVAAIGLSTSPGDDTPYVEGVKTIVLILFRVIPMMAWALTLLTMKGYSLTGERMEEVQAVSAVRKEAIAGGMSMKEAMEEWQTIEQAPEEFR